MPAQEEFKQLLSETVDRRREEITRVKRVVAELRQTNLAQTAMLMAVPLLYAHWEGFVKETVELYMEYIEKQSIAPAAANPIIFSFAIRQRLAPLLQSGSIERISEFVEWMMSIISGPMKFDDKTVETKANLSFENLKSLCETLCIDVARLQGERRKINGLVHRRNNIAHTGRPPRFDESIVENDAALVLELISTFETILNECVTATPFLLLERAV
jgi:MAE_28990/MAE_18760-like HEPN